MQIDTAVTLFILFLVVIFLGLVSRCAISLRIHFLYMERGRKLITTDVFSIQARRLKRLEKPIAVISLIVAFILLGFACYKP